MQQAMVKEQDKNKGYFVLFYNSLPLRCFDFAFDRLDDLTLR